MGCLLTRIAGADGEDDLADVDTSDEPVGLAEGAAHAGLQTIGSCARQHLVDADDVVRVGADTEVEPFLACHFHEIPSIPHVSLQTPLLRRLLWLDLLVGADTSCLEGLGAQLLILVGDEMDAAGEFVDVGALAAEIEDADLGVWHTAVEA